MHKDDPRAKGYIISPSAVKKNIITGKWRAFVTVEGLKNEKGFIWEIPDEIAGVKGHHPIMIIDEKRTFCVFPGTTVAYEGSKRYLVGFNETGVVAVDI